MALLNDSWIGQYPIWQVEGNSKEVYKMKVFYRRRFGQESYLAKEKDCFRGDHFLVWKARGLAMQITSSSFGGWEGAWGRLIWADQKIPHWPINPTFLGEVETAIRLGIKSSLGTWSKWHLLEPVIFFLPFLSSSSRVKALQVEERCHVSSWSARDPSPFLNKSASPALPMQMGACFWPIGLLCPFLKCDFPVLKESLRRMCW